MGVLKNIFYNEEERDLRWGRVIIAIILLIALVSIVVASFVVVPAGHKGVIVTSPTGPDRSELSEGWHWNPYYIISEIDIIRYNTQTSDMSETTGGTVTVRSSDNLDIKVDCSLVYHLPGDHVADIRIERGSDWHNLVDRYMRNTPRNVASNYTGEYIGGYGRVVFEDEIRRLITQDLGDYDIIVEDFLIRSVELPWVVDEAIEQKKAAEQQMVTADYLRNVTIINADADRRAAILEAQGIRNATIIMANGTAEAIRMVMEQLQISDPGLQNVTEAYLTLLYLQALTDPDSNIQYIIITDGGTPIIIQPRP